jgi:hypothetical protein
LIVAEYRFWIVSDPLFPFQTKWIHELGRFKDIRVLVFGFTGGISNPFTENNHAGKLESGDIIVCEYSSLPRALGVLRKDTKNLHSFVIDCRHATAFRGSHGPKGQSEANSWPMTGSSKSGWDGPPELISTSWWRDVMEVLLDGTARRMLIEFPDADSFSLSASGLGDRQQLDILAFRAACIVGPRIFQSSTTPLHKRVVSWARRKGKKSTVDKVKRVRHCLEDVTNPFWFDIEGLVTLEDAATPSRSNLWWELRRCALPSAQREEYDKSCSEIRGALSSSLVRANCPRESGFQSFRAVSNALFRLRRQCIHSKMQSIFSTSTMQNRLGHCHDALLESTCTNDFRNGRSGVFYRKVADSPSQPDVEIALSILEESAKLRELVSILKFDCDYKIAGEDELEPLLYSEDRGKASKSKSKRKSIRPRKVAILAVLPEVQLLVSALLNSIGVKHDLLLRSVSGVRVSHGNKGSSGESADGRSGADRNQAMALAWAEYQMILSKFNSDSTEPRGAGSTLEADIVVTSPVIIAGDGGGLGVEKADLVICLDEDWSGRGELMMKNIAARCLSRNKVANGDRSRLIRLVCADTWEEKLLEETNNGNKSSGEAARLWPLDYPGYFCLPTGSTAAHTLFRRAPKQSPANVFGFPGIDLFKLRNEDLSKVLLSSKPLPPFFGSGSQIRFLPFSDSPSKTKSEGESAAEAAFLMDLLVREQRASIGLAGSKDFSTVETSIVSVELTPFCNIPPAPASFPKEVMTRQDLSVIASRLYLERNSQASALSRLGVGAAGATLALLPGAVAIADSSATVINSNSQLVDAWHKRALSSKPDDQAASLLFYKTVPEDTSLGLAGEGEAPHKGEFQQSKQPDLDASDVSSHAKQSAAVQSSSGRFNSYAHSFSASRDGSMSQDGNQGCEALVYFPPLFPNMLRCSMQANEDTEVLRRATRVPLLIPEDFKIGTIEDGLPNKRKAPDVIESRGMPNAKRLRFQHESAANSSTTNLTGQPQALPPPSFTVGPQPTPTAPLPLSSTGVGMSSEGVGKPGSVDPPDPVAGFCGDLPNEMRVIGEDDTSQGGLTSAFFGVDEDFGLLGMGAIALPGDSAIAAANDFVEMGGRAAQAPLGVQDDLYAFSAPCDLEEVEAMKTGVGLNSMILFVKKRQRGFAPFSDSLGQFYRPPPGAPLGDMPWVGMHPLPPGIPMPGVVNNMFADTNGAGSTKKVKKRVPPQGVASLPSSAFSRLPSAEMPSGRPLSQMPVAMQFAKGKDLYQHRLLASFKSRQIGTGLTMFQSPSYRVAAIHVQNRVAGRLAELCWTSITAYEAGPGLPLILSKNSGKRGAPEYDPNKWTSIVKRLKKDSTTGESAKLLSTSQRSALRRSLVSPCRVDFGPFRGGFLASPSGMTGISPPRSRLGVSLPMGVKVPQALREQLQHPWTPKDDTLLQDCAVRFGMNWMLVARALSGYEDVVATPITDQSSATYHRAHSIPRSANQCRDRWQALARSQPSLANEVRKSERVLRESALMKTDEIPVGGVDATRVRGPLIQTSNLMPASLLSKPPTAVSASGKVTAETESTEENKVPVEPTEVSKHSKEVPDNKVSSTRDVPADTKIPKQVDAPKTSKRSFSSLTLAKTKKQVISIPIPGVVTGQPATLVPSHPSHMQSVQASVAAQWSSGRTEFWPLQILDFADKQRAAAEQRSSDSTQAVNGQGPPNSSTGPTRKTPSGGASTHPTHRSSSSQASSNAQRDRIASFPPVPASNARSGSQRPQTNSPKHGAQSTSTAVAQAYVLPTSAPHQPIAENPKPTQPPTGS